jgi:hypothetical protein
MTEDLLKRLVDAREWMSVRRQRESWGSPAEVVVLDPEEWDALDVAITALAEFGSARAGDDEARRRERILREALNGDDDAEKLDALGLYLEKYPPPGFADRYSADGWRHIARGVLSAAGIFFAEPSPSPGTDFDPVRDGFRW